MLSSTATYGIEDSVHRVFGVSDVLRGVAWSAESVLPIIGCDDSHCVLGLSGREFGGCWN